MNWGFNKVVFLDFKFVVGVGIKRYKLFKIYCKKKEIFFVKCWLKNEFVKIFWNVLFFDDWLSVFLKACL